MCVCVCGGGGGGGGGMCVWGDRCMVHRCMVHRCMVHSIMGLKFNGISPCLIASLRGGVQGDALSYSL